jgi:hypothetical protein
VKITLKQLRLLGACTGQVALFKATFGAKVEITEAVCKEHGSKFDTDWLAAKLFSRELYKEYRAKRAPFLKEYQAKRDQFYAEYRVKCAPLDAEYRAKCALVFLKCLEKMEGKWETLR